MSRANREMPCAPDLLSYLLPDDGTFPNNARLPLREPDAADIEALLRANGWGGSWRNGVYSFHHYHSTAHEVLVVYGGSACLRLGGERGIIAEIASGDVVIITAGVAHKNLGASADFRVVGAYAAGQAPDMNDGSPGERPRADETIARLPLPARDPIYEAGGPLTSRW